MARKSGEHDCIYNKNGNSPTLRKCLMLVASITAVYTKIPVKFQPVA